MVQMGKLRLGELVPRHSLYHPGEDVAVRTCGSSPKVLPLVPLFQVPVVPLPTQLPTDAPSKAMQDDPRVWAPALRWKIQKEPQVPGYGLARSQLLWLIGK